MRKLWKFALLGGAVGVAVTVVKSGGSDQSEDKAGQALRVGGSAAAAGAAVGLVLDRRARKKAKRGRVFDAVKSGSFAEAAKAARPVIEHAMELARPRVEQAAGMARERASELVEQARPTVEKAARRTRKRAKRAAKETRKRAEKRAHQVTEQAQSRIEEVAAQAREALSERAPVIVRVA